MRENINVKHDNSCSGSVSKRIAARIKAGTLTLIVIGRSYGSEVIACFRLPGFLFKYSQWHFENLLSPYVSRTAQDFHLIPFSPLPVGSDTKTEIAI